MKTAIFDMDGLLLDTEPLWGKSMLKVASHYRIPITPAYFKYTTGLRIIEVTHFWAERFPWPGAATPEEIAEAIIDEIISLSKAESRIMPGVETALNLLRVKGGKIGLATSSPIRMIQALIPFFGLQDYFDVTFSADTALLGKPHPEVYLQCAAQLDSKPWNCVAFEDSVNGMIAAKAARMKVVAVPDAAKFDHPHFQLADIKLKSLSDFSEQIWRSLED